MSFRCFFKGEIKNWTLSRVVANWREMARFFCIPCNGTRRVNAYKQSKVSRLRIVEASSRQRSVHHFFFFFPFLSFSSRAKTPILLGKRLNGTLIPHRINVFPTLPQAILLLRLKIKSRDGRTFLSLIYVLRVARKYVSHIVYVFEEKYFSSILRVYTNLFKLLF